MPAAAQSSGLCHPALCALRFPGRLLQPGEVVPREVLVFVADQLDLPPEVLADYAARPQTRYDQLDALYSVYGLQTFTRPDQHELAQWLLPVALTTTSGAALAGLLLEELRRRAIAAPGPSVIERLVATALLKAERHVDRQIDASFTGPQRDALEALLEIQADTALSVLAWTRQATGLAGHRALARLIDQLVRLRSLAIDPSILEGIHTDGGGVSDHVFALCHLLGFRFAPRIPNLDDRRLHTFGPATTWPTLEPFIAGKIDEALITTYWDDLLRLATSVRLGTVPASLMLRRLGSYPRQNGLALALREVGRIERTLVTLDWLDDPALRRQATAELNKGESRNALARAVCFHRLGRLRDRTLESQQHRAGGLNLVVAAIVLWNTAYMERAIHHLRARGEKIPNELMPYLAPLGWQHINLTGDYIWTEPSRLHGEGFRPLAVPSNSTHTDVLDLSA